VGQRGLALAERGGWIACSIFSLLSISCHIAGNNIGLHGALWSSGLDEKVWGSVRLLIRPCIILIGVGLAEGILDRKGQESTIATYYFQPAHRALNLWRHGHTRKCFIGTSYTSITASLAELSYPVCPNPLCDTSSFPQCTLLCLLPVISAK
jgi:hypothetical protein